MHLLPNPLPWFVVGPLIGLVVVVLYAVANKPLGTSVAYHQVALALRGRATEGWRAWYWVGLVGGCLAAVFFQQGGIHLRLGYSFVSGWLPLPLTLLIMLGSGIVMGYGARWAGGCTTGHGLCGSSARSFGGFVATGTFFLTAIVITNVLHVLTGGRM